MQRDYCVLYEDGRHAEFSAQIKPKLAVWPNAAQTLETKAELRFVFYLKTIQNQWFLAKRNSSSLFYAGTGNNAVNVPFIECCSTSFFLSGSFCDCPGSSSQQFCKVRSQVRLDWFWNWDGFFFNYLLGICCGIRSKTRNVKICTNRKERY